VKVSILVPVYNVEKYIGRCLESLFNQTFMNLEYIFVNDCTSDSSVKIIEESVRAYHLEDKCKLIQHDVNLGISQTRNDCLKNASGDYILFVDSDDYIEYDMVESLLRTALKENADVTGCSYIEEFTDNYSVKHPQHYYNNHAEMMKAITLLTIKGVLWKLLIKRDVILRNHLSFPKDNSVNEDYYFCCKLFYFSNTFAGVDRFLYHYVRYNPNNLTKTSLQNIESQAAAIQEIEIFYREKGVYEIVENELNIRKFVSKLPLLLDKSCFDVIRWRNLFPESNNTWKKMEFSLGNRFLFLWAQSPFYSFISLFMR
jgi:glycosyltransferase involved in cell wall biosynthesis